MQDSFAAGSIIVVWKEGVLRNRKQEIVSSLGLRASAWMDEFGVTIIEVPQGEEVEYIEEFKKFPEVSSATPNYVIPPQKT